MSGRKRRPRLLFINHWAKSLGGAEYSLIDILKAVDRGIHCSLITAENGALLDRVKDTRTRRIVVKCSDNILLIKRERMATNMLRHCRAMVGFFVFLLRLRTVVRRLQPDCIHANVPKSHMAVFFLLLSGYRGTGILHMRELFPEDSMAYRLYRLLSRHRRLKVIAISEAVLNGLPPPLKNKATVIYNGVYIPPNRKAVTGSLPVKFLYLGRIVPWKGCHLLIDFFYELLRKLPFGAARLQLVGPTIYWDSSYRTELMERVYRLTLENVVSIEEKTETPYEMLAGNHVLCMPSSDEPFGRVAAEAQGCGLPVIGFASGGLKEIIIDGETGILVPPGDREGFVNAMLSFVEHPERIAVLGKNGHIRAGTFFNRDVQIPAILSFLKEPIAASSL